MNETIEIWKILNLSFMAAIAAIFAGVTFGLLLRKIGGGNVKQKVKKIESQPMALAIYLSVSKFAIYYLFATIFTRF